MEVRSGYKQTEVGVIPEDWECTNVRNIASPIRNAIVGGPFGSDLVSTDYVEDGIPVVRGGNMGSRFVSGSFAFVSKAKAASLEANLARPADLVFTQRGTLGQVSLVPDQPYDRYLVSQSQMKLTLNCRTAYPLFFYYVFSGFQQQDFVRLNTIQTGVPHINLGILRSIPVQRPLLAEQEAIAEALSDADALIESLEQLLAKKRQLKQGAMQDLLTGKKRLSGFIEEWEVRQIGQFTDCTAGGTPSTTISQYWGGAIRWMNSGELNLKMVAEVEGRITEEGLRNSSTKMVSANCVLIGLAGQGKTRGTVAMNLVPLCTNQSIAAIFPNSTFVSRFLYYNLDARYDELRELSAGDGGRGGLNLTIIRQVTVPFPSFEEQTAIAAVLSDMDAEISGLDANLDKARSIKQGMMQALLTGRIRLT